MQSSKSRSPSARVALHMKGTPTRDDSEKRTPTRDDSENRTPTRDGSSLKCTQTRDGSAMKRTECEEPLAVRQRRSAHTKITTQLFMPPFSAFTGWFRFRFSRVSQLIGVCSQSDGRRAALRTLCASWMNRRALVCASLNRRVLVCMSYAEQRWRTASSSSNAASKSL